MVETAIAVPGRENVFRITLNVRYSATPHAYECPSKRLVSPASAKQCGAKKKVKSQRSLHYADEDEQSQDAAEVQYVTPTQRYFDRLQKRTIGVAV